MTFEPLIHQSFFDMLGMVITWAVAVSLSITGVTYIFVRRSSGMIIWMVAVAIMSVLVTSLAPVFLISSQNRQINTQTVFANISKKYEIQSMEFKTPSKYLYPEQSEAQPVLVQTKDGVRSAFLTQDEKTSEPTLTDADNGKPMDDILKTKQ